MTRNIEHSILTYTGRRFYPLQPAKEEVDIRDIAHALSNLCRYTGHTRSFYSIAQHCVLVSREVPEEHALTALLHDAGEAYLADIASPVKKQEEMAPYRKYEAALEKVIAEAFRLPFPFPACVKEADLRLYATERRDLMPHSTNGGWPKQQPLDQKIETWWPDLAKSMFVQRYYELERARDKRVHLAKQIPVA